MQVLRRKDMTRIRVLLYHDRNIFDRSRVLLSPLYTAVSYFRTLKSLQVLSWLFWLALLAVLRTRLANRIKGNVSLRITQTLAFASSLFLLTNGVLLNVKSQKLKEYNDIYTDYSSLLLWCGAGFLIYSFILIFVEHKRKPSIINQN